jgi:hypothetical protein
VKAIVSIHQPATRAEAQQREVAAVA